MTGRQPRGMIRPPALDLVAWARVRWDAAASAWQLHRSGGGVAGVTTSSATAVFVLLDDTLADAMPELVVTATKTDGGGYVWAADRTPQGVAPPSILFQCDTESDWNEISLVLYLPRQA